MRAPQPPGDRASAAPGLTEPTEVDVRRAGIALSSSTADAPVSAAAGVAQATARSDPGVSYAVARLHQRLFASLTERVAPYGLTTLQFTTLSVLSRHGAPLSTSQLARRAFMTPQSMSEVIHALESKGLIRRNPHPNHRRTLPATLTAKGRRVLVKCDTAVAEFEDAMLDGFSEKDRAAFLDMVKAAVRNLGGGFPND